MNPRLPTSKKWTRFPVEYVQQIEQAFSDAFSAQLVSGKLILEGRIYPEEITLRVGYLENGKLQQANFEVSVAYNRLENQDAIKSIHNCIDAAASMMGEYFANDGVVEFPRSWKEYDFEGQPIFVQYSTVNSALEAEANRLLGLDEDKLVHEEATTEDAFEKVAEVLPADEDSEEFEDEFEDEDDADDESIDTTKPTLFSKKRKKGDSLH